MKNMNANDPHEPASDACDESFELNELDETADDFWNESGDDGFEFDKEADAEAEELEEALPEANQIGLLLSAITSDSSSSDEAEQQQEAEAEPQEVVQENSEPEFETIHNGGDAAAIEELNSDPELRDAFLDDALKCLSAMEQAALKVENEAGDRESIRQFCRELHTLKGASASVGLSEMASYLHDLESSLDQLFRQEGAEVDTEPMFAAVGSSP